MSEKNNRNILTDNNFGIYLFDVVNDIWEKRKKTTLFEKFIMVLVVLSIITVSVTLTGPKVLVHSVIAYIALSLLEVIISGFGCTFLVAKSIERVKLEDLKDAMFEELFHKPEQERKTDLISTLKIVDNILFQRTIHDKIFTIIFPLLFSGIYAIRSSRIFDLSVTVITTIIYTIFILTVAQVSFKIYNRNDLIFKCFKKVVTTQNDKNEIYLCDCNMIFADNIHNFIGKDGKLMYNLPADMKFFKEKTIENFVIMGLKTFESIGCKPLNNRHNLVITHKASEYAKKYKAYRSLYFACTPEDALVLIYSTIFKMYEKYADKVNTENFIWIIGGASIYTQMLPYTRNIYETKVLDDAIGDTSIIDIASVNENFKLISESEVIRDGEYDTIRRKYERIIED